MFHVIIPAPTSGARRNQRSRKPAYSPLRLTWANPLTETHFSAIPHVLVISPGVVTEAPLHREEVCDEEKINCQNCTLIPPHISVKISFCNADFIEWRRTIDPKGALSLPIIALNCKRFATVSTCGFRGGRAPPPHPHPHPHPPPPNFFSNKIFDTIFYKGA